MNPLAFPLLADENIHPEVIAFLSEQGCDVRSIAEQGAFGQSDLAILRAAHVDGRVVLTHDGDFGMLAVAQGVPFTGVVYLRPGHIRAEFTIQTVETLAAQPLDVRPPFIVVAEQRAQIVHVRIRQF